MTNCRRSVPGSGAGDGVASLNQPPPFLTKTYDIVDDPATDPIIAWGADGTSFVVWKHSDFARDLLPRHFKHNNFSSFVRQLNTYGFRKVDPDRWEFANENFIRGHKELLRDIHRRKPAVQVGAQSGLVPASHQSAIELGNFGGGTCGGITDQVDNLKRDKNVLMLEVVRLRQQQQEHNSKIKDLQQRLETTEQRQHDIMMFLARVAQNPAIISQLFRAVQATAATNVQRITNTKIASASGRQTSPPPASSSTGQEDSIKPGPRKKRRQAGDSDSDNEAGSVHSGDQLDNGAAIIQYTPNQNGDFSEFFFKQLGMLSDTNSRQDSDMVAQAFHNLSIAPHSNVPALPSVTIHEQSGMHPQVSEVTTDIGHVLSSSPPPDLTRDELLLHGASPFTFSPPPLPVPVIHGQAPPSAAQALPLGPSVMVTADPTVTMMGGRTSLDLGSMPNGTPLQPLGDTAMMHAMPLVPPQEAAMQLLPLGGVPVGGPPHLHDMGMVPMGVPIISNPEVIMPEDLIEDFPMELMNSMHSLVTGPDGLTDEARDEFWNQLFASNEHAVHQLGDGVDLNSVLAHDLTGEPVKHEDPSVL